MIQTNTSMLRNVHGLALNSLENEVNERHFEHVLKFIKYTVVLS